MSEPFDPYHVWLGIPPESRPPTHYELLGISPNEREKAVIEAAVLRQSGYVRNFQLGKYAKDATKLLNEIAAAKTCLLDPAKRAEYDAELKSRQPKPIQAPSQAARVPIALAPLPPAVDLDLLAAAAVPPALRPIQRRRPASLMLKPRKRKTSNIAWQLPVGAGIAVCIVLVAIALWPKATQRLPPEVVLESASSSGVEPDAPQAGALPDVSPPEPTYLHSLPASDVHMLEKSDVVVANPLCETPFLVGNVRYRYGLWMHPRDDLWARASFALKKRHRRLAGAAAVADIGVKIEGAVFRIIADGRDIWSSRPLREAGRAERFEVDVSGVERLELRVECTGSNFACHTVWLDPLLDPPDSWPRPPLAPPLAIAPFSAEEARQHQERWAKYLGREVEETNSIGMKMVLIPPGEFDAGTPKEELERLTAEYL